MKKQLLAASVLVGSLVGAVIMAAPAVAVPPPSCSGYDSYNYATTGLMSCVVPAGMTQMQVVATGAGGGGGGGVKTSTGGHGAIVTTVISVTPGETISLEVGSGGGRSLNAQGGGGGGYTAVLRGSTKLVIAGGGGGGGAAKSGTALTGTVIFAGGNGGQVGADGAPASMSGGASAAVDAGHGGTASAGGPGGSTHGAGQDGFAGTSGAGGRGGESCSSGGAYGGSGWQGGLSAGDCYGTFEGSGGGGGAGYFGGGGGGASYGTMTAGNSGGGGSSYVDSAAILTTYAVATNGGANHQSGDYGQVVLSLYTPPAPPAPSGPSTLTLAPGFVVGDLAPSAPVTLSGADLQPSSNWSADIHSTVVQFANGVTDSSGNFSLGSNLPASIDPGQHVITLYGIANDGSQWTRVLYITVGANLRVTYMSTGAPETALASTGVDLSALFAAALLGVAGLAAILIRRRVNR